MDSEPEEIDRQKPTGELTQVSDGNTLWSYWKNGDSRQLTRRNIQEILQAADESKAIDRLRMIEDLGAGGLQTLLARLETGMEFGKVREQTVGETRLLVVSGRWTQEAMQRYFKVGSAAAARPVWMPDYVRVYIDAEAQLPRRVQYLKTHPNPQVKQVRPLITLDFRGMTVEDTVDDERFKFEAPQGLVELDRTEQVIENIRRTALGGDAAPAQPEPPADAVPAKSDG